MKKSMLALAALTAFAGAASAQSSVTIFGIVDVAARSVSNGSAGSLKTLSPSGQASSRLGFRGIEDLGGGMRAGFWLEGDLTPDNGNAAGMSWTRRSTVSLLGGFGEVRMGRDYTPTFVNFSTYDAFSSVGVASPGNVRNRSVPTFGPANIGQTLGSGATTTVRADNTISYFLPAMGGLYGQVQVAAGEAVVGNRSQGARLGYAAGPLNVSGAYEMTKISGGDHKTMNFGGSFNLGFLTIQGVYEKSDWKTLQQKIATANVIVPVGQGQFKAVYTKSGGNAGVAAKMYGLGYVYNLSKRTSVYTNYASIDNDLTSRYTTSTAGLTTAAFKAGETSKGYEFGIRHDF
jgi:predicted porin